LRDTAPNLDTHRSWLLRPRSATGFDITVAQLRAMRLIKFGFRKRVARAARALPLLQM
jgi:hypothetical protein